MALCKGLSLTTMQDANANIATGKGLRILLVGTSRGTLGQTTTRTGAWVETLAEPYYEFLKWGYMVDFASTDDGPILFDPISLQPVATKNNEVKRFLSDDYAQKALKGSRPIWMAMSDMYAAAYIAGGHGMAWDGSTNEALQCFIEQMCASNKPIAAVDHGVCALVTACISRADDPNKGQCILYDKKVTGVTNRFEEKLGRTALVPFLLENVIAQVGGHFECSRYEHVPYAVRDGQIVTGQNPASSRQAARLLMEALSES